MADKKINIGLGFNVDKTNLNTLKTELQSLLNMSTDDLIKIGSENAVADLKEIQTAASAVQSALEKSFNPRLNTQDLAKFQQELKMSGQSISSIKAGLDKAGASGQNAFRNLTAELLTTNRQLKQSNEWLDKMADTMANTVRWTVASSALNAITGSVQKAYSFTKQLDTSLNDIRIVTGKSADEMARFAKEATTAAKNLGSTTTAYTKAALIYEQQGLGAADVQARSDVTTKVSNVTGQSAADVSEQLTAIWNGYKVSAAEAELYIDKVSAVAATTAADLEELSEGMGKVASAANSMGVDIDQLNASLATIISVTRQDASAVGTSLKTIYARMGDLAVDGEDEFGVKLGDVSGKLKTMGVDILDAQGQMREMGEVIEEVAAKWDTWTSAQQQAAAVALAGKRQYNNLIALFENWDMYEEAKSTSKGGAGELQKQQDIYMESMEAHLNQLQAEAEELYQTLLDPEGLNPLIDALTGVVGLVENLIESLGGGAGLLRTVGAIGFNVFGKQITKGITSTINNITSFRENLKQAIAEEQLIKELEAEGLGDERQQELLAIAKKRLEVADSISEAEHNAINSFIKQTNELYKQEDALKKNKQHITETAKAHLKVEAEFDNAGKLINGKKLKAALQEQLQSGFSESEEAGIAAQLAIEESAGLAENIEKKQGRVTYRKRKAKEFNKQGVEIAAQAIKDSLQPEPTASELINEDQQAAIELSKKAETNAQALIQANIELRESEEALAQQLEQKRETIERLLDKVEEEIHNEDLSADQKRELLAIQEDLTKAYNKNGTARTKNKEILQKAAAAAKKYNVVIKDQHGNVVKTIKEIDDYNKKLDTNTKNIEENAEAQKKLLKNLDLTKTIEGVTNLTGGIFNLTSGIETLLGLGNIWSNEDLTGGEKLLQTVSSLSFALPQMISGFSKAKESFASLRLAGSELITNLKEQATSLAVNKTLQSKYNLDLANGADRKKIYTLVSKEMTLEEKKHLRELIINTKAGDAKAKKELEQIVAEKLHVTSLKTLKISLKETAAAALSAIASMWPLLVIAAAVGAIAGAIHLIKAYNTTDEEAFNNAKQRQNELSQALQETKQKYDDLKNSIEDYKNARNSLDELTAGTTAWKEALADANSQALALLQTYPELAKYIHKDENGLITISEEGLNKLADKQLNDVYRAQTASLIGGAIARDAKDELDTSNKSKDFGVNEKTLDAILKLESDTILNPEEFANSLKSESIGIKDEALINSLNENREEIFALKQTVDATNHLLAVESGEIVGNILNRYGYGVDSGVLGGIITSNMLAEGDQQEAIDELKKSINISSGTFDAWAHAMGIEADAGSFKNDTWNAQVKYTVDGEEKTISYDQFKKELATYKYYYENTQQYLNNATELLAKVGETTTTETNNVIRSVFASNQAATKDSIEDYTWATAEEIKKVYTEQVKSLTESQYSALETAYNNLTNSLTNMASERGWFDTDDAGNAIQNALVNIFGAANWDALIRNPKISHALLAGGGDALSRIGAMEGEQGLKAITDFLSTIDDQGAFLSGIDWSSETLGADIVQRMHEFNMEVDYTDATTSKAIMYFSQLNGALETTAERAANTKKIIDGLDYGSVISKEDFVYLRTNYGDLVDNYFVQMEDGTAVLTASAWDFYEAYHKLDLARRQAALDKAKEDYDTFKTRQENALIWNYKTGEAQTASNAEMREQWVKDKLVSGIEGSTITIGNSKVQYRADADQYDWVDLNGKNLKNEQDAIELLKAWFKTENGAIVKNKIEQGRGKTIDALTDNEWNDILEDQGLAGFFTGGGRFTIDYSTAWNDAQTFEISQLWKDLAYSQAPQDEIFYTYDKNIIQTYIRDLVTKGLINQEQYDKYFTEATLNDDNNYKVSSPNEKPPIYDLIKQAVNNTPNSVDLIKTELQNLLGTARTQEEFDTLELANRNAYQALLGDNYEKIIEAAQGRAQINFEQAAIKKHEISISNVDEAYQNLNETIESLNKQLDNTFGQKRVDTLNQINNALDRQNELLKLQSRLNQNEINRQFNDSNSQVYQALQKVFGKNGDISKIMSTIGLGNGDKFLDTDEYNKLVDYLINNKNVNPEATNTIVSILGPLFDDIIANENAIVDNELQKIENALDAFDTKFREAHERNEIAKSYNDFMRDFAAENNDYFEQFKYDISSYKVAFDDVGQSMSKIEELAKATVDETGKGYIINGETLTLEQLRTQVLEEGANLQEYALSLKESLTNLQELEIAQVEEIAEQYDNIVGYAESWNEFLEHGLALQELIHGENYEATKDWYEAQAAAIESQLDTQKSEYVYWKTIVAEIEAGTRSDYTYDEARAKMLESGKEVAATSAELGQVLYDNFERAWNSHFTGFERAKSEYEWISSQAERTFDTITGALESQKLINDWTKTMNETLDKNAQKRMKEFIDLQEEKLKNLREENKLSQYNLDLAQAEFDLLQAQIALEDARNNKTQMRLTRGADGSYSYQYVADDQAIAQAEGQVAEAAKNRLDIVKKEMDSQVNNFYDDIADLQNLLLEYAPDDISETEAASLDARKAAIKKNFDSVGLRADLKEAVKAAAEAAGIEGYENRELEDLITDFPEFKGYLDIIKMIENDELEKILAGGTESVGDLMRKLGSLATPIGTSSGEGGTLMGEIKDLLAGLTDDELTDLAESIGGLEQISKAADAAKDSFNTFAKSIGSVIAQLANLGTATSGSEWSSILFGENGEGGLSGAIATAIGGAQTLSEETIKAIQEGTSAGIKNYLTEYTPTANQGNTTSTITNETTNYDVNVYIPTTVSKEEVLEVLDEVFNNTEQAIHNNGRGGSFKVTVSNK